MGNFLPDALAAGGLLILSTGVAMAYGLPAALMVAGTVLLGIGVLMARGQASE